MARTKITPVATTSANRYENLSNSELKKKLDERKMEGRSKLTTKAAMVEALTFQDAHPDDKLGLAEVIQKQKHVNIKNSKSSSKNSEEPKVKTKKQAKKSSTSANDGHETVSSSYELSSVGNKIKTIYPKDYQVDDEDIKDQETVNTELFMKDDTVKLLVTRVPSKEITENDFDDLDDVPLVKKSRPQSKNALSKPKSKPQVDPDATEDEDPKVIEEKKKEIKKKNKVNVASSKVSLAEAETEEDEYKPPSLDKPKGPKFFGLEMEDELEEPVEDTHDEQYISTERQKEKEISQYCGNIMELVKIIDLKSSDFKTKTDVIKQLKDVESLLKNTLYE